jgi:hypothetical protein
MADVSPVVIRPLTEADLVDADRVFRVAFGTFLRAPDPRQFFGDAEFVRTRWHADNHAAFAAVREGRRAWKALAQRGFRTGMQGVTMHRPNDAGYSHSDSYVIDDWR